MATAASKTNWRPGDNFRIATAIKSLFAGFLPADCLELALATCRFCFQGPESVGATGKKKNWGYWIRTSMQTSGRFPEGFGKDREYACHRQGRQWVSLDCHEVVSRILGHIGLTIDDVYDEYGKPEQGERYFVDLAAIVRQLAPDCLTDTQTADVA